jgi:hypothetical protein
MAVTARAKDSRCTSASRLGNLGHIRSISVLLKPEFAALAAFDVGSQSARICRKHWPSQSNTPRPTVLADILYELQTRPRYCAASAYFGASEGPARANASSSARPISRVPSDEFLSSTVRRKKSVRSNPLWRVPYFPARAALPQSPLPPVL